MQEVYQNRVVDWIFNNLRIILLLFLFLVVFGSYALSSLQSQGFPDVAVNIATVSVVYPNAPAADIEDKVVKPMEAAIENVENVKEYQTIAYDSVGVAIVTFEEKADLDKAIADLKEEIDLVKFPEDSMDPETSGFSIADVGHFMIAVTGPSNEWGLYEAGKELSAELDAVSGVKSVKAMNPLTPEIIITFDDEALAKNGLNRAEVEAALQMAQFKAPVGYVLDGDKQVSIVLEKSLRSLDDIRELQVGPVKLSEVARVEPRLNNDDRYNRIGFREENKIIGEFHTQRAIIYSVTINDDADLLNVSDDILALVEEVKNDSSHSAELVMMYSQAEETEIQINEITSSLFGQPFDSWGAFAFLGYIFGGLSLVVLLLLIFMNARVAIMAALSVPLSLFFASIYLYLVGINLNTLVLFSMVLVIGLVVDPTIVFLESLQRYKAQGLSARQAAAKTMTTVGTGVLLAVMTNILVFVPFGVVSGLFGEIIKYIPATVIPAMIASMLIPILFYMPLASRILSSKRKAVYEENPELTGTWFVSKKLGEFIKYLLGPGNARLALRIFVFAVTLASPFLVATATISSGAVEVVQFAGEDDMYQVLINGDIDESYDFETAVYEFAVPTQQILSEQPEIKKYLYYQQTGNSFTILAELFQSDERKDAGLRTSAELVDDLNKKFGKISDQVFIEASTTTVGPPSDSYPIRVSLTSDDQATLEAAANDIVEFLADIDGVDQISNSLSDEKASTSITYTLDSENPFAQNPGLVYAILSNKLQENDLGSISFGDETFDLYSRSSDRPEDLEAVTEVTIGAMPSGTTMTEIKVGDVVKSSQTVPSKIIKRTNGSRYVDVAASFDEEVDTAKVQRDLDEYLSSEKLEELGLDKGAITSTGAMDMMMDSFNELFIALAIAIFLIYILLVAFFRSYLEPFIILFAIPLGLVGVFMAAAVTTGQLGFLELLGVVTMAGIVVNVTILLIDFANQLKRAGKTPAEAISTSVAVRFRPIVLTQLTALGGLMPLVFFSAFWKGLAAAIIFGIVSSAFLSLLVTPILYLWSSTIIRNIKKVTDKFAPKKEPESQYVGLNFMQ